MTPPAPPEPIIIFVVGITGTGKSTFIKEVTGLPVPIGDDLESLTHSVSIYKARIAGKEVWFVDTPGFNDTHDVERSDTMVLDTVSTELVRQHRQGFRVNGVVYLHKITEDKMLGSTVGNLLMLQKLVGDASLANVTLATTKWDLVTEEEGNRRERQLKERYWSVFIQYGAKVARIRKNDHDLYLSIVHDVMRNMGVTLQIQRELGDQGLTLEQTGAGQVVLRDVLKATAEHTRQLKEVNDELRKAREKGEQDMKLMQQLLENQKSELSSQLQRAARDRELLQKGVQELQQELASRAAPPPPPPPPQPNNLNVLDCWGGFPLYWAVCGGRYHEGVACDGGYHEVKRLLDAGAIASMRTRYLWTPLHWAVGNGHMDVVQLLLAYGADVNAVSDTGKTPLSMAKTDDMRQLLRQKGAIY